MKNINNTVNLTNSIEKVRLIPTKSKILTGKKQEIDCKENQFSIYFKIKELEEKIQEANSFITQQAVTLNTIINELPPLKILSSKLELNIFELTSEIEKYKLTNVNKDSNTNNFAKTECINNLPDLSKEIQISHEISHWHSVLKYPNHQLLIENAVSIEHLSSNEHNLHEQIIALTHSTKKTESAKEELTSNGQKRVSVICKSYRSINNNKSYKNYNSEQSSERRIDCLTYKDKAHNFILNTHIAFTTDLKIIKKRFSFKTCKNLSRCNTLRNNWRYELETVINQHLKYHSIDNSIMFSNRTKMVKFHNSFQQNLRKC